MKNEKRQAFYPGKVDSGTWRIGYVYRRRLLLVWRK